VVVVTGLALAFVGYYNRQVTGNALLFPHVVNQQQYESLPVFIWGSPGPPRSYSNAQFEQFYNVVTRKEYSQPLAKLLWKKSYFTLQFFLGSALWIPLIAMPWTLGDRRIRLLLLQLCLSGLGLLAVRWFEPHYAAPLTAVIFAVLIQSMRHLRRWQCRGRPVGVFITRLVVLLVVARVLFYVWQPPPIDEPWSLARARVVKQLEASPGRQLVLVRYGPNHNAHDEWVYNAADIDHSRIVWAREIPGVDLKPLLDYFRGRTVWVLEPDRAPLELTPYRAEAAAQSVTPAH
jgi:hypothetical protein